MRTLAYSLALLFTLSSCDQAHAQAAAQTMYARTTANIRGGAGTNYNAIGKVSAGQAIEIAGDPLNGFYPLTTGGFVSAAALSANPVTIVHVVKEVPFQSTQAGPPAYRDKPPAVGFRPGDCAPYSRVINIAGQAPQEVRGTACMQQDGTWRIVNGNAGIGMQVPAPPQVSGAGPRGEPIYSAEPGQPLPPGAVPVQGGLPWQR